jgi:hypothetical protein
MLAGDEHPLELMGLPRDREEPQNMTKPKFKAGQTVTVLQSAHILDARGSFRVVCALPEERGVQQYRIKSSTDGHVRVVMESEIA